MSLYRKFNRQSHRLPGWDYRTPASYFITLCTQDRIRYFDERNTLSIARRFWRDIPKRHPHVELGDYEFVHNHMHGIITITRYPESFYAKKQPAPRRGVIHGCNATNGRMAPLRGAAMVHANDPAAPHDYYLPGSVGAIMQGYKTISKRVIRFGTDFPQFDWQRDFYDHIIRDKNEYASISAYIRNNLLKWDRDRNNPASPKFIGPEIPEAIGIGWNEV